MKAVYNIDASVISTASAVATNNQTQVTIWKRKRDRKQHAAVSEANCNPLLFIWLLNTVFIILLHTESTRLGTLLLESVCISKLTYSIIRIRIHFIAINHSTTNSDLQNIDTKGIHVIWT